ncbi:hypothetical protein [Streptomyces sp. NPDC001774]
MRRSIVSLRGKRDGMTRRATVLGAVCALALTSAVVSIAPAGADSTPDHPNGKTCSNKTLKGRYAWDYIGWRADASGTLQPIASAGHEVYDGEGGTVGFATDSTAGEVVTGPFIATYHINPDCTGTWEGQGFHFRFYVEPSGKQFHFVQDDPGSVAAGLEIRVS